MAIGNWAPELVEMAGGINLFGEAGAHSPWMTWEQLVERDPDVIITMPCGFDLERTSREMHWLTERPGWSDLRAVRDGQVYIADGNQYFNRPGPRVVESLQILAEILHPALRLAYTESCESDSSFLIPVALVAADRSVKFVEHTLATDLKGGYQVIVADVNHDGKPDLIALASGMKELVWFENPTWERHVIVGQSVAHDQLRRLGHRWRRHSRDRAGQPSSPTRRRTASAWSRC